MPSQPNMLDAVRNAVSTLTAVADMMYAEDRARAVRGQGDENAKSPLTKRVDEAIRELRAVRATLEAASRELMFGDDLRVDSRSDRSDRSDPEDRLPPSVAI
jgi:hypothetical protein